jgi:predicted Rossmann fold nucleotide-binding protein DprA/Smf involved in DNA uptake
MNEQKLLYEINKLQDCLAHAKKQFVEYETKIKETKEACERYLVQMAKLEKKGMIK